MQQETEKFHLVVVSGDHVLIVGRPSFCTSGNHGELDKSKIGHLICNGDYHQ